MTTVTIPMGSQVIEITYGPASYLNTYRLRKDAVAWLYENVGLGWEESNWHELIDAPGRSHKLRVLKGIKVSFSLGCEKKALLFKLMWGGK